MLVLSRHRGESIIIGDRLITFSVVDIRGDKVRIGVEAPRDIPVHRSEVYAAIHRDGGQRPLPALPTMQVASDTRLVLQFPTPAALADAVTHGRATWHRI